MKPSTTKKGPEVVYLEARDVHRRPAVVRSGQPAPACSVCGAPARTVKVELGAFERLASGALHSFDGGRRIRPLIGRDGVDSGEPVTELADRRGRAVERGS